MAVARELHTHVCAMLATSEEEVIADEQKKRLKELLGALREKIKSSGLEGTEKVCGESKGETDNQDDESESDTESEGWDSDFDGDAMEDGELELHACEG